ncbi:hypothetical protein [Apibacter adventoris]|uniref:Uncharacterized protein n=1 Tax=Apibacter adventoris TaxID=1679466 RepID=A0A2S8A7N3_9FLAO|nr:hypothetical protein [Apibacter adventoris]PQL90540.1 hypothetical protein C4S77_11695 [Apibacter adventoris]
MTEIKAKAYYYSTMMKTAYLWLPVFTVVLFICSYFEKLRFFLFLTVGAATYGLILNQMKKKSIQIIFSENSITIDKDTILLSDIVNYHICLPLNELFMLRVKTKNKNLITYIGKEFKEEVEIFLKNSSISENKTVYDISLKYSHLILPFIGLLICGIIIKIQYIIKYN